MLNAAKKDSERLYDDDDDDDSAYDSTYDHVIEEPIVNSTASEYVCRTPLADRVLKLI